MMVKITLIFGHRGTVLKKIIFCILILGRTTLGQLGAINEHSQLVGSNVSKVILQQLYAQNSGSSNDSLLDITADTYYKELSDNLYQVIAEILSVNGFLQDNNITEDQLYKNEDLNILEYIDSDSTKAKVNVNPKDFSEELSTDSSDTTTDELSPKAKFPNTDKDLSKPKKNKSKKKRKKNKKKDNEVLSGNITDGITFDIESIPNTKENLVLLEFENEYPTSVAAIDAQTVEEDTEINPKNFISAEDITTTEEPWVSIKLYTALPDNYKRYYKKGTTEKTSISPPKPTFKVVEPEEITSKWDWFYMEFHGKCSYVSKDNDPNYLKNELFKALSQALFYKNEYYNLSFVDCDKKLKINVTVDVMMYPNFEGDLLRYKNEYFWRLRIADTNFYLDYVTSEKLLLFTSKEIHQRFNGVPLDEFYIVLICVAISIVCLIIAATIYSLSHCYELRTYPVTGKDELHSYFMRTEKNKELTFLERNSNEKSSDVNQTLNTYKSQGDLSSQDNCPTTFKGEGSTQHQILKHGTPTIKLKQDLTTPIIIGKDMQSMSGRARSISTQSLNRTSQLLSAYSTHPQSLGCLSLPNDAASNASSSFDDWSSSGTPSPPPSPPVTPREIRTLDISAQRKKALPPLPDAYLSVSQTRITFVDDDVIPSFRMETDM